MDATNVHIFDPEEPITIKTDGSKHAVGAVLEQNGYPIASESKKMGTRDKFLPAYESELLAIVYALTKWKSFIGSKLVTVETDHATLSRMLTQNQVTSRLGYWLDKLADFNIKIVYKPGKQNVVADAISRRPDLVGAIRGSREKRRWRANEEELRRWERAYLACRDFATPTRIARGTVRNDTVVPYRGEQAAREGIDEERKDHVWYNQREYVWKNQFL
ncbi:retrotransposon ty3-gypsy subclass [Cystoisospora suis]|uniref:Retrotransposon ty3-gypsy subclass n=1 Tax=Cystoisospora suis TaxID=483139 RepID=A0A2C6KUE1_9APIC|nr:retrotransposon ty3-gypsy subclass [Cystoisospora suis]